jgi:hypothetical protein
MPSIVAFPFVYDYHSLAGMRATGQEDIESRRMFHETTSRLPYWHMAECIIRSCITQIDARKTQTRTASPSMSRWAAPWEYE